MTAIGRSPCSALDSGHRRLTAPQPGGTSVGLSPAGLLGCSRPLSLPFGPRFHYYVLGENETGAPVGVLSPESRGRQGEDRVGGSRVSPHLSSWAGLSERGSVLPRGWCALTTLWLSGERNCSSHQPHSEARLSLLPVPFWDSVWTRNCLQRLRSYKVLLVLRKRGRFVCGDSPAVPRRPPSRLPRESCADGTGQG